MTEKDFFDRFLYDPEKDLLGSGGFGSVYRAYDKSDKRYVAIKISQVKDIYGKFTLLNEVELSKSIDDHANVARYEFGLRVMRPFLVDYAVMAFYEEGNLDMLLRKRNGQLSEKEYYEITEGILEGIKHLHSENIIHRDLKLANILMHHTKQKQWRPKIADFGLSRQTTDFNDSISNSAIGITFAYASPEQIENRPIKKNVDLWAFGVILYRLMTGQLPFMTAKGTDPMSANLEISRKIVMVDLPKEIENIPQPYHYMIRRCFIKDTHLRAQVADELLDILKGKIKIEIPVIENDKVPEVDINIEPLNVPILSKEQPVNPQDTKGKGNEPATVVKNEVKQEPVINIQEAKESTKILTTIEPPNEQKLIDLSAIIEEKPKSNVSKPIIEDIEYKDNAVQNLPNDKNNKETKKYAARGAALALLLLLGYCGFNKMNKKQEIIGVIQEQPVIEGNTQPVAQNENMPVTSSKSKPSSSAPAPNTTQTKTTLPPPVITSKNNTPQQTVIPNENVPQTAPNTTNTTVYNPPIELEVPAKSGTPSTPNATPQIEGVKSTPLPTTIVSTPAKTERSAAKIILTNGEGDLRNFVLSELGRGCRKILPASISIHNMKIDKSGKIDDSDFFILIKSSNEVSSECKNTIKNIITEYKYFKGSNNNESICEPFTFNL